MRDATARSGVLSLSPTSSGAAVWDRLWQHQPSDATDDAKLAREVRSRRWECIVRQVRETFGSFSGLTAVELGSGRGDLSVLLARLGVRVTLLDASARALEQARRRFDRLQLEAELWKDDMLGSLDGLRGRFDLALSSGVIEHFKGADRTRVIRAHHDVLSPGGMCVISVPNAWCIPYRLRKLYQELRGWWPYGLELPYSKSELTRRALEAGFARTDAWYMRFDLSLRRTSADEKPPVSAERAIANRRSSRVLDRMMGLVLLLCGWRSS